MTSIKAAIFEYQVLALVISHCCFSPFLLGEELQNLSDRQKFQQDFDEKYFEINEGFEKIRHILLHLVKTTGKMATYCEALEHGKDSDPSQMMNEVLPDLLIHALQIANYYHVDLDEKYDERIQFIIDRRFRL